MKLNLDAILAEAKKASPGEWTVFDRGGVTLQVGLAPSPGQDPCIVHWMGFDACDQPKKQQRANATFIAHARTNVPLLVGRVRELEKAGESLWALLGDALKLAEGCGIRQAPDENSDWFCSWCHAQSPTRADLLHAATCKWKTICAAVRNACTALGGEE